MNFNLKLFKEFPNECLLRGFSRPDLSAGSDEKIPALVWFEKYGTSIESSGCEDPALTMEQVGGIEPPASAWKAEVLPLYDTRTLENRAGGIRTHDLLLPKQTR